MSIKTLIKDYIDAWDEQVNKHLTGKTSATIDLTNFSMERDTLDVSITVTEDYNPVVKAKASIDTAWIGDHLDELNQLREDVFESAMRASHGYKGEAVKRTLLNACLDQIIFWEVEDNRLFI